MFLENAERWRRLRAAVESSERAVRHACYFAAMVPSGYTASRTGAKNAERFDRAAVVPHEADCATILIQGAPDARRYLASHS